MLGLNNNKTKSSDDKSESTFSGIQCRTAQSDADDTSKGKCQVNGKQALFLVCQSYDR